MCGEALVAADLIGQLDVPVLLYGVLAQGRTRAELRKGGPAALAKRLKSNKLQPDFGPPTAHSTAGVTLVAARPPLVAFNVELAPPATEEDAQRIAQALRESGAAERQGDRPELPSTAPTSRRSRINVEDHIAPPLAAVIEAVRTTRADRRGRGRRLRAAEAFENYPNDLPTRNRRTLEDALAT